MSMTKASPSLDRQWRTGYGRSSGDSRGRQCRTL